MKIFNLSDNTMKRLNAYSCFAVCIVLILAQLMQVYLVELPCPLCLLQRVGFIGIAFGFLLNAYDRPRPAYYFTALLSAILTISVGLRQVLLHIVPNTGVYGSAVFGLHLYTWSVVIGSAIIVWITLLALMTSHQDQKVASKKPGLSYRLLFLLLITLALVNTVTTFGICGLSVCPSDPTHYIWQLT